MIRPLNEAEDWPGMYPEPTPTRVDPYWIPGTGWHPKDEMEGPELPAIIPLRKNRPDVGIPDQDLDLRKTFRLAA